MNRRDRAEVTARTLQLLQHPRNIGRIQLPASRCRQVLRRLRPVHK